MEREREKGLHKDTDPRLNIGFEGLREHKTRPLQEEGHLGPEPGSGLGLLGPQGPQRRPLSGHCPGATPVDGCCSGMGSW